MWKGVLFFLLSVPIILLGLYSVTRVPPDVQGTSGPLPLEINYAERVKRENVGMPSYIKIPSLYLYADIEVGKIDEEGKIMQPKNQANAAVFIEDDRHLGQKGVVVLVGNFDDETGDPSTFYYLSSLQRGDFIEVTDLNGKKYEYVVRDKSTFDVSTTDIKTLFNKFDSPRLVLIMYSAHTEDNKKKDVSKTIIYAEIK